MTPVELSRTVLHAVRCAVDDGELRVSVPERVVVTEPGPGGCGDFATNVALQLARPAGQSPLRVAEILRPRLVDAEGIRDVVVTGPGFLNICLDAQVDLVTGLVREIRERGAAYGHGDALAGQVVALCVPYEVRAEAIADAVVRIVATQGGRATVEHGEPVNLRPVPAPEDPAPLGADASQWALLYPAPHDRPRITADHLVQREGNPLFRVRYAHARIRSLGRNAARLGFAAEPGPVGSGTSGTTSVTVTGTTSVTVTGTTSVTVTGTTSVTVTGTGAPSADSIDCIDSIDSIDCMDGMDGTQSIGIDGFGSPVAPVAPSTDAPVSTSPHPPRATATPTPSATLTPTPTPLSDPHSPLRDLLTALTDHPRILTAAATHRAPDRLARHLVTVADAVLPFLPSVLPRGEEKPSAAHRARLALAEAAGTVLAGGLYLLGIDAPEHL
ncbi:ArgS-related anticodon-binding protein NrtL [Streptomyces sp. NPDC046759]|uniref:ArgS-related anticodon-binding protein NrtL n=1 Tax=Streptomyces sp. NPDC046759 TaxID=3155019 RepID=UPI0033C6B5EA